MNLNLIKKSRGVAVLEAVLTLPVICYLILFILEAMKVNNVQTAIDAITTEATFDFMSSKNTNNFATIVAKHRPTYVKVDNIKWYFAVYKDLGTMCAESPYGGEDVFWPETDDATSSESFLDSDGNETFLSRKRALPLANYKTPEIGFAPSNGDPDFQTLSGKAFVLTFVCDYEFSSPFVEKLFAGGSNTKDKKRFLIWGRGVGICN